MISVIVAPESAQQTYTPPPQTRPAPRLDRTDERIIEAVRDVGPVKTWSLFNWLAEDEGARSRADGRDARRTLWDRVRRLKALRVVFGVGRNELTISRPDPEPTRRRKRRRKRSVGRSPCVQCVSAVSPAEHAQRTRLPYPVAAKVVQSYAGGSWAVGKPEQSESVITPEQASAAARALATVPRRKSRKWTGWLHGEHCWRGRPVVLPTGEVAPIILCNRGRVLLQNVRNLPLLEWLAWGAIREHQVTLWKNPAAVALGQAKRGVTEAPSEAKAASCRANGHHPARPGHRPRGRPRRSTINKRQEVGNVRR